MRSIFTLALFALAAQPALGYDPPSATAGPLTVRMQAPASGSYGAGGFVELSRPGVPMVLPVSLQNSSERELRGTLRVAVMDQWSVDPAGAIPFRLGPRGRGRHEFVLKFGEGTYNAHYPVHVYAEFEDQGQKLTAHPVLIMETRIPDLPRPKLPAEWKAVPVPAGGTLGLWRMPVRRERAEVANFGAEAGRTGREVFDAGSVVTYGALGGGQEGIGMTLGARPPAKREMVESASVEYALELPAVKPIRLETRIRGTAAFRVEAGAFGGADLSVVMERRVNGAAWEGVSVDLDRFAGSAIRLRLAARGGEGRRSGRRRRSRQGPRHGRRRSRRWAGV